MGAWRYHEQSGPDLLWDGRILVDKAVYQQFIDAFKSYTKETSKVGDPFAETAFQGPQISKTQYDRIMGYIDSGVKSKALGWS